MENRLATGGTRRCGRAAIGGGCDWRSAAGPAGACVSVNVLPERLTESPIEESSGESFEIQNRPWQRGQFA